MRKRTATALFLFYVMNEEEYYETDSNSDSKDFIENYPDELWDYGIWTDLGYCQPGSQFPMPDGCCGCLRWVIDLGLVSDRPTASL